MTNEQAVHLIEQTKALALAIATSKKQISRDVLIRASAKIEKLRLIFEI